MLLACTGIVTLHSPPRRDLAIFAPARSTGPVDHPYPVRPRSDWRPDAETSVVHVSDLLPCSLTDENTTAITRAPTEYRTRKSEPAGGGRALLE